MAPRSEAFKRLRQRLRRSLHYGNLRMNCLTIPLSQMVVDYFDHHSPYDYLDMDFAASLSRDGCIDPCTLIAAMIYLERLRVRRPKAFLSSNPNDLYLSAIMVATKFMNDCGLDEFVWNDEWAETSKLSMSRVNQLELRILDDLEWDLMISKDEFDRTLLSMERYIATRNLADVGFLSYGDANILATDSNLLISQMKRFMVMSGAVMSAYLMLWALSFGFYWGTKTVSDLAEPTTSNSTVDGLPTLLNRLEDDTVDQDINEFGWRKSQPEPTLLGQQSGFWTGNRTGCSDYGAGSRFASRDGYHPEWRRPHPMLILI